MAVFDLGNSIGTAIGLIGLAVAIVSIGIQGRQTQIMEAGLNRAIDENVPDSEVRTERERQFRDLLNRRLNDVRTQMRKEISNAIEKALMAEPMTQFSSTMVTMSDLIRDQHVIADLAGTTKAARDEVETMQGQIFAETGKYAAEIEAHRREIEDIQQRLENLRARLSYLDMVRSKMQQIGQQIVQMTSQQD